MKNVLLAFLLLCFCSAIALAVDLFLAWIFGGDGYTEVAVMGLLLFHLLYNHAGGRGDKE